MAKQRYTIPMKYVKIETPDPVIDHAVNTISSHLLSGKRVVWLLSGGSAIDLEVRIAQQLQTLDVSRLYVGLIDERYGPVGHKDENYLQLMNAYFPLYISRVLLGKTPEETAKTFGASIQQALEGADFSLGIFGIGADGHTAGIKPHSPAITSSEPTVFYEWDDYQRITLTPPTIRQLDEAIIYAVGSEKADTLRSLLHEDLPIAEHPAQVLKGIKTSALYTDNTL